MIIKSHTYIYILIRKRLLDLKNLKNQQELTMAENLKRKTENNDGAENVPIKASRISLG